MNAKGSMICNYCKKMKPKEQIVKTTGRGARGGLNICVSCWKERHQDESESWHCVGCD